jgi:hypothetical protein
VKVLQLGGGVAVLLPAASALSSGALPTAAEGGVLAAIVGGTVAVGSTLSWYCQRLVGELTWRPETRSLRISTLTMWGERKDDDISMQQLAEDGFAPAPPPALAELPLQTGFVPLQLCGRTYIFTVGPRHVQHPQALLNLLGHQAMPFPPDELGKNDGL